MSTQPDQDAYWMQRALELARRGIGLCSPNPVVGCVILGRAGQLAGEGWPGAPGLAFETWETTDLKFILQLPLASLSVIQLMPPIA